MDKLCKICGENNAQNFYTNNKITCKKCCIERQKEYYIQNKDKCKEGYKKFESTNILRVRWLAAKHRAIRKNIEFTITMEELENLLIQQNNKCYYTGVEFENDGSRTKSISIDRIDSNLGYTIDNIRLICSLVNTMKSDRSEQGFLNCVQSIYKHMYK